MILRTLVLLFLLLCSVPAEATSLFWVASGGTYSGNINDTAHIGTASGGAGGHALPTNADDFFIDGVGATGGDKTITLNASQSWRSCDMTGGGTAGVIISHSAAVTITVGGTGSTGCKFEAGGTYTAVNTGTSVIALAATNSVSTPFKSAGYLLGLLSQTVALSSWSLQDDLNANKLTVTGGVFNANGKTLNVVTFNSNTNSNRTLGFTNATANVSGPSGTVWDMTSTGGASTFSMSGFVINLTGNGNTTFIPGSNPVYGTVNFLGSGTPILGAAGSAGSYTNLARTGTVALTDGFRINGNPTISGTFTATGNSLTNRLLLAGVALGTNQTITAAAVSLANVDFVNIVGAGAAAPFTGTSLGDGSSNSNITFTPAVTRYAIAAGMSGGVLNWSSTNSWSATPGGTGGASVPIINDTAVYDNNSTASFGQTIQWDLPRIGSVDMSGMMDITLAPLIRLSAATSIYGNVLKLPPSDEPGVITFAFDNAFSLFFSRQNDTTVFTPYGVFDGTSSTIACPGGTVEIAANNSSSFFTNAYVKHSGLTLTSGTFDLNANDIVVQSNFASAGNATRVWKMGGGKWQFTGTGTVINISGTGLTITPGGSTIYTGAVSGTPVIAGGGYTFGGLSHNQGIPIVGSLLPAPNQGVGANLTITGANTFAAINGYNAGVAYTITLPAGVTTTATSFVLNGAPSTHVTLQSSSAGTPATVSVASGNQISNYLNIKDSTATGGAAFYARGSQDNGDNSGWNFGSPPGSSGTLFHAGLFRRGAGHANDNMPRWVRRAG